MGIKKKIVKNINDPYRQIVKLLYKLSPYIHNDVVYLKLLYYFRTHRLLHLNKPKTFGEKLQWLKLFYRHPIMTTMVDKYAAKEYVANIIGEKYIIPTIGVWDKPEDIEWDLLPSEFVLKTTHGGGSAGVIICKDKSCVDRNRVLSKLNKSLKQDIYIKLREWPYRDVPRRIIAEKFISNGDDLIDYKFFCFNGEPKYCQVIKNRDNNETIDIFDENWNHQKFVGLNSFCTSYQNAQDCPVIPLNYSEMLTIARRLSEGFPYLRVDLYDVRGSVYFGEITFFPTSGFGTFSPIEWNEKIGSLVNLPHSNS